MRDNPKLDKWLFIFSVMAIMIFVSVVIAQQPVNQAQFGGTAVSLGQKAMSASVPVALASDQSSIPVAATLNAETTKVIGEVNQGTSPWVTSCTVGNCSINVGNWGGTALGTPTNFGTTPGAVIAGSVNASIMSGTTALGAPNTFGTTAPTGNALGVNASCFIGTTLCINDGTAGALAIGGHFADNGNASATNRVPTLPCITRTTPGAGTGGTSGNNGACEKGTDGLSWTANLPARRPASYYASTGATGVTVAASATDIFEITGNATTDVLVTKLKVACTQTTAGTLASTFQLIRRSTADGAASTNLTKGQDDSGTAASSIAAAGVGVYTANPTLGNTDSTVDTYPIECNAAATGGPNDIYILNRTQKPIVLVGTTQQLVINLNGKTVTGGIFYITVEWIEVTHETI